MTFDWIRPLSKPKSKFCSGSRRRAALAIFAALQFWAANSSAESMDFALERLAENASTCRTSDGYSSGIEECRPDNAAFINLVNQFGMAVAPSSMYPANTTGYGGFEVSFEGTYTTVNSDADYMKRGTRGSPDSASGAAPIINESPASVLQLYSLRIRKGFGFGLEAALQFGVVPSTSLITGGADFRASFLEGFREGVLGYFPDFAVTGSVRTTTGSSQVQMNVIGFSGMFSKPITIKDSGVLTPMMGYQHLFIFGSSGVIDFTPAESAQDACGFAGPNQPGTPGTGGVYDGSPVCDEPAGTDVDYGNSQSFESVSLQRQRLIFGVNYQYEVLGQMLNAGGQVMLDVFNKESLNKDEAAALEGEPSNTAFSIQVGVIF